LLRGRDVVIVGVGRVGRLVAQDMRQERTITVIDVEADRLAQVPDKIGQIPVLKLLGDATSRLVLQKADLDLHTVLIVVTGDDAVNREVARLAREHYATEEIVTLVDNTDGLDDAGLSAADVIQRYRGTASLVLSHVSVGTTRGVALGLGEGELLQVRVMEGSAAIGSPLKKMNPNKWLVGAVYRDDSLIVPHGDTRLQVGDRVLLVGEPEVLVGVGAFIRGGQPVFPAQFGTMLGVMGNQATASEADWFLSTTLADDLVTLDESQLHPRDHSDAEITAHLTRHDIGCLIVDPMPVSWAARVGLTRSTRQRLVFAARVPVLAARGTHPYKRVLLALSGEQHLDIIASAALDVTRQCGATLTVLTVLPPSLAEGTDEQAEARAQPERVATLARLYGVEVEKLLDHGNPIERIRHHAANFDLLVVGCAPDRRNSVFTPNVSLFLLHDVPCSTLLVPGNLAGR
jgi:uncharacterized protein